MIETIDPYYLLERGSDDLSGKAIYFRSPTVDDYRKFAGMPTALEEELATQFLNSMQVAEMYQEGEVSDSALWTGQDRRTALYWIYINTRENTVITQKHHCQHCDKPHTRQFDLKELVPMMISNDEVMRLDIAIDGVKAGYIQPLRGNALVHIEEIKNERDMFEEDSPEWCLLHVDLRLYEIAWSLVFEADDRLLSLREQAKARFDYISTLNPETTYKKLAAKTRAALEDFGHGLMSEYRAGEFQLVTPLFTCPESEKGEGEPKQTVLLLPFWSNNFLPSL